MGRTSHALSAKVYVKQASHKQPSDKTQEKRELTEEERQADVIINKMLNRELVNPPLETGTMQVEGGNAETQTLSKLFDYMKLNPQKVILFTTAAILLLMLMFPPFHSIFRGTEFNQGYRFHF
jgi:hypothetical protein